MPRRAPKAKKTKVVKSKPVVEVEPVKKRQPHKKPFYKNGISKVKIQISQNRDDISNIRLSDSACEQLNFVVQVLARELSSDARKTCVSNGKKTVSQSEIKLAVSMRFQGQLLQETMEKIEKSIKNTEKASNETHEGPIRREVIAGLSFPVCLTGKFIRNFGNSGLNMGKYAPIALTAALEYVADAILVRASEKAKIDKRVTIKPRHMYLAIFDNSGEDPVRMGLANLMNTFNIEFMGVGVCPFIHDVLKEKKKGKTIRSKKKGGKAHHRPGTVALRNIKELQQNGNLLLQKSPFGNIVKQVAQSMSKDDIRFGSWTKNVIQSFVEERAVQLIQVANEYVVMSKREGVKGDDLLNAWSIKFPWVPETENQACYTKIDEDGQESLSYLGKKGIKRLSHRAGAKSLRSEGYPVIRRFVHSLITIILTFALKSLRYRNVITIGLNDLQASFHALGYNYALLPPKIKTTKKSPQ